MTDVLLVPVDPHALAARTSALELDAGELEQDVFAEADRDSVRAMLALLPPLEAALVLANLEGHSRGELARALGVTRQAVRKRLRRALQRLFWLAQWPGLSLSAELVAGVCRRHLRGPLRSTVLAYWPRSGARQPTQAELGARYGVGQGAVHRRLVKASRKLAAAAREPDVERVAHALAMLVTSRSILRYEPQKAGRARRLERKSLEALNRLTEG